MIVIDRALSVQQPWAAALMIQGADRKPLENRGSTQARDRPPISVQPGTWIGIHAGKTLHDMADLCLSLCPSVAPPPLWPRGALLGAIRVVGWLRAEEALRSPTLAPWVILSPKPAHSWCLVVEDPRPLPAPIPMRGMLGLFPLSAPVTVA
jgi:hypothetical protein